MRYFILLLVTSLLTGCDHKLDPTLPGDTNPVAISSLDRVYTADQSSNTVSVIDPSTDKLLGQIKFGNGRPDHLSPLYNHEVNVHGLGVSPDNRYLAVVSTLTNSVSFVDLMTNLVSMKTYVGRNPHEGFFSPDGKQYWLAVRGENYVSVIDMSTQQEIRRVVTANGPSMVVFRPDGLVAFVNHSFTAEIDVVDTKTYQVIKRVPVVSPFSPNLAATFDGNQVWFTHKDIGKVSVLNARTYDIEGVIDTGPGTNHVNFAGPDGGTRYSGSAAGAFAYVTVGGENAVKVYSRDRQLVATIPTGPNPHGVWPSGDGSKVYVGLENGDAVDVIDTKTNTRRTEIASGQAPQALIYVAKAVPPPATGLTNLVPLASGSPLNVRLSPVGTQPVPGVGGGVTLRTIDGVDEAILMLKKLAPTTTYTLYLSDQRTVAVNPEAVLSFTTDDQGAVETYAYYQIKLRLTGRYMLVLQGDKNPAAPIVLSTP